MPSPSDSFDSLPDRSTAHFPKNGKAITTSDTVDLSFVTRSIWVGVTGDIAIIPYGNTTAVTYKAVPAGRWNVRATRVMATNTTATNLVAEE